MTDGPEQDPAIFQRCDTCVTFPYTTREYAMRALWQLVRGTLFRWSPRRAYGWRNMLLQLFGAKVESFVQVRPTCKIFHPWLLEIGHWTSLADDVEIYNLGPVKIGSHSVISQGSYVCAGTHDYTRPDLPLQRPPIRIGSGVWIAAQVFVGPGVTVGDNSVIGARAVVTRDVPSGVVAGGNPARVIKPRTMRAASGAATSSANGTATAASPAVAMSIASKDAKPST